MRRVVIGILTVLLLLCVGIVAVGYPLLTKILEESQDNVAEVMQRALYQTSSAAIADTTIDMGALQLRERDLSVNNEVIAGEAGWESGTSGTVVYGLGLSIRTEGIFLVIGDEAGYSGVPTIVDGRIELTDIESHGNEFFESMLTEEGFERVIESGLNQALAAHGLVPTDLSLHDGYMTVEVLSHD